MVSGMVFGMVGVPFVFPETNQILTHVSVSLRFVNRSSCSIKACFDNMKSVTGEWGQAERTKAVIAVKLIRTTSSRRLQPNGLIENRGYAWYVSSVDFPLIPFSTTPNRVPTQTKTQTQNPNTQTHRHTDTETQTH